jgi:hypothetical protein
MLLYTNEPLPFKVAERSSCGNIGTAQMNFIRTLQAAPPVRLSGDALEVEGGVECVYRGLRAVADDDGDTAIIQRDLLCLI